MSRHDAEGDEMPPDISSAIGDEFEPSVFGSGEPLGAEPSAEPSSTYPDVTEDSAVLGEAGAGEDGDLVEAVEVAEAIARERDEYLDLARRVQAEFENYKRRVDIQRAEQRERAAESLALELLPVLDAGEAALSQGLSDVEALHAQLLSTMEKQGLGRVTDADVEFDPAVHEAVMHEEGDGESAVVSEVLRTGYTWNGRVLRPAMVKVRG